MPKISLAGFRDPSRRPRYVIWGGAVILGLAAFVILAMGVTSTRWFCSVGCHKVQDDTIMAYEHSSHSNISCMACHMPVNADPLTFTLHKAEALGELYLTATGKYELPLNGESHVALEMPAVNCTQCHSMSTRNVTPTKGIIIDHQAHTDEDIACTVCHNRIAHREDFELKLKDPQSGEPNRKHDDFMEMDACFRCHSQSEGGRAPGDCLLCHPKDFDLKPPNHDPGNFVRDVKGRAIHAQLGAEDASSAIAGAEVASETKAVKNEHAEEGEELPPMSSVSYCGTCHDKKTFCNGCHGVEMPHPIEFATDHGTVGKQSPQTCANCHAQGGKTKQASTQFCNGCHHKDGDPSKPWIPQHYGAVAKSGASACFECHDPVFCARCHVRGGK